MPIITLTTDLGIKDFYLAAVKGSILSSLPDATIIDITHQISSYNIAHAAFILGNAYYYFPDKTVHIVSVDNSYEPNPSFIAVKANNHYFICPDNGLLSLFLKTEQIEKIVKINLQIQNDHIHFPIQDILVKSAVHLAKGNDMELIGRVVSILNYRTILQPITEVNLIRGSIIYVDSFSNAITNINQTIFDSVGKGRNFTILFKRNETVDSISTSYSDVPEGEKLCLFGITGYLEVAINKGKASSLLGLNLGETIIIQFQ